MRFLFSLTQCNGRSADIFGNSIGFEGRNGWMWTPYAKTNDGKANAKHGTQLLTVCDGLNAQFRHGGELIDAFEDLPI